MLKETLILSGPDIEKLITMPSALRIAEQAFTAYGQGKIQMPAKIYLRLDKYQGDFRAMPAYIEGVEACGMKWVNVHPQNLKHGLPSVMALIIINDPKTGLPLAVMDGTYITNLRTGAAGGIAAKYLARENSSRVALVGCGAQAQTQLMALNEIFNLETVSLYDCVKSQPEIFLKKMRYLDLKMSAVENIPDCLKNADILVTTTPSRRPIIKPEWIKNGTHINAIGADASGKEELETGILKKAKVVVDDITQAIHSGEINVPMTRKTITRKNIHADLGEIITGKKQGRKSREEITVFDSTGLAILDVAMAHYAYQQARKNKVGKTVKFY
ncbi:MAG: alanine dehydrogenase [Candidatus Omnitrophota bacterium]|nr:alanine dehydrogenase [Candidatus Omnitrophota bacterium]